MDNNSALKAIIALSNGKIVQCIQLQMDDEFCVAVYRNKRVFDIFRIPHRSIDDEGNSAMIQPLTIEFSIALPNTRKCICPPTDTSHNPSCTYYAPSPQEIYRSLL